ncbi:hypothetical protein DPMN_053550 [Dreissena polymorpha]|uniref:Uncharacterized protein n=1 Tax=Dreissena polymorpha TaxID=45954 RepID=A0A9D4CNZ9_DREPO|nr:hypothetical protein DPMN_053550 [Dreissena polymorpha]
MVELGTCQNVVRSDRNYLYDATQIESVSRPSNPFSDRPTPFALVSYDLVSSGYRNLVKRPVGPKQSSDILFCLAEKEGGDDTELVREELRTNVIELAEDGFGLTGNGIPTGTMGKLTRFELDKDGLATWVPTADQINSIKPDQAVGYWSGPFGMSDRGRSGRSALTATRRLLDRTRSLPDCYSTIHELCIRSARPLPELFKIVLYDCSTTITIWSCEDLVAIELRSTWSS